VQTQGAQFDLCVLGCADGKFVLPAARRGLRVHAVDVDTIALFGGMKPGVEGDVYVPGLCARLQREGLEDLVTVHQRDLRTAPQYSARLVFTSGAIQYSLNLPASADELLRAVVARVAPGGLLYIDYMLPFEDKLKGRPNCPPREFWRAWAAKLSDFEVLHNRVLPPVLDRAHVEMPFDHYHQWGHLMARRNLR
jgi:hypothetical protein